MKSRQLTLPVTLEDNASFDNYLPHGNEQAVAAVQALMTQASSAASAYLFGPSGTGKSHLLIAAVRWLQEQSGQARYLSLADTPVADLDEQHNQGLQLIAIDDVQSIADDTSVQRAVMQIYEQRQQYGYRILFAGNQQPGQLQLTLPDLVTRLAAGSVFALVSLSDDDKVSAIRLRAQRRGLQIEDDVIHYAMSRLPRDNATLFGFLDAIDDQSLAQQRRITKPLVRELLSANAGEIE